MPRQIIDYLKNVIYKIVCNDLNITECYVGHTTEFIKRKSSHKSTCNNENSIGHKYNVYQFIRENGGWNNWSMIEIEKYPCNDNNEASTRERFWLETLKATLNNNIPSRTVQEYKKEYDLTNKEKIKEYRDTRTEKNKLYAINNKDKTKEYKKQYYLKQKANKLLIQEVI